MERGRRIWKRNSKTAEQLRMMILCLGMVVGLAAAASDPGILASYTIVRTGYGTFYSSSGSEACQLNYPTQTPIARNPAIRYRAAINRDQFYNYKGCGMCFLVRGSGNGTGGTPITGEFTVYIDDLCAECTSGSVDLNTAGEGRWVVQIKAVPCPVGNTKIEYVLQSSNPYYLNLQVRNSRIPITEVSGIVGGRQAKFSLTSNGFWTLSGNFRFPFQVQLTTASGEVLFDTIPRLENNVVLPGRVQSSF